MTRKNIAFTIGEMVGTEITSGTLMPLFNHGSLSRFLPAGSCWVARLDTDSGELTSLEIMETPEANRLSPIGKVIDGSLMQITETDRGVSSINVHRFPLTTTEQPQ